MIRNFITILIIAGAPYALTLEHSDLKAHNEEQNVPVNVDVTAPEHVPDDVPVTLEEVPYSPGSVPSDPERDSVDNGSVPAEVTGHVGSKDEGKTEGTDLKTDATFWWPFYYRSYYGYPYYRSYRPRVYYRYYYW